MIYYKWSYIRERVVCVCVQSDVSTEFVQMLMHEL